MQVMILQHEAFEGAAGIGEWLAARGHGVVVRKVYAGEAEPGVGEFEGLVMMGGGMSVNEEGRLPWLVREKELVRQAVSGGKRVLGVCLGAQMIASALGGRVFPNKEREVGWFPVRLTEEGAGSRLFGGMPREFVPCHWHGETFDLPAGAVLAASSEGCRNQAFFVGERVVGLQFHLEYTGESVELMLRHCLEDTTKAGRYVQEAGAIREGMGRYGGESLRWMGELMGRLFG